jgi:amidase
MNAFTEIVHPMATRDFHDMSVYALSRGLERGDWTSVDLTTHFLNRILVLNPKIHAVPFVLAESALDQAHKSDLRRAAGQVLSALDGVPMTIKDTIRVKGYPSPYGTWFMRNYVPKTDSRIVEVLRGCGLVLLGRTAMPTAAFDWNCRNQVYPECVNPIDPEKTPGGSSGGAAAALASGMTPLDLGSDLAGSIRYPAHCCGVFGLRLTDQWLPIDDVGAENSPSGIRQILAYGPMTRFAEDLDLLLDIFEKKFPSPSVARALPNNGPYKIAYSSELIGMRPESSTQVLFDNFLRRLSAKGHTVVETKPNLDFDALFRDLGIIAGHEMLGPIPKYVKPVMARIVGWWLLNRRLGKGPVTRYFSRGFRSSETEYREACDRRKVVFGEIDRFFAEYPLWVLPVAPSSAIPRSVMTGKSLTTPSGTFEYTQYMAAYTAPTAFMGTPAFACPIGVDDTGMPVGVQIHARRHADRWLARVGAQLETALEMRASPTMPV